MGSAKDVLESQLDSLKKVPKEHSCRELSLAITKLEEAIMWLEKVENVKDATH